MFKLLFKKLVKDYNEVPLLWIDFNLNKFQKYGADGSCIIKLHPSLKDDQKLTKMLEDTVDYIRSEYDMELITK